MLKSQTRALTFAALALSLVIQPAHAAKLPQKAPASQDGMTIKLVSARKYGGKAAKHMSHEKVVKAKVSRPEKIVLRDDAKAKKSVAGSSPVMVVAAKAAPIEKMKPISNSATPKVVVANVEMPTSSSSHSIPTASSVAASMKQRQLQTRPQPNARSQMLAKNQPSVKTKVVSDDSFVADDYPSAERDLVDTLDRLPVERAQAPASSSQMLSTRISSPAASTEKPLFSPILQLKNRLTTGRKYELEEIGGKNFSRKHEIIVGAKHRSGFGASVTGSVSSSSYDDTTKDKQTTGDITTMLYHPTLYTGNGWDVYGFGRVYFPTSDASKATNSYHYFYYFGTNYEFMKGFRLENGITPHYWTKDSFADDDTYFLLEEELIAKYDLFPWLTLGFGPYAQVDCHERSMPGTSVEVTPILGFNLADHVYFESKMYMPVYTDGQVGGGPRRAALSEIAGEFYLKLFL